MSVGYDSQFRFTFRFAKSASIVCSILSRVFIFDVEHPFHKIISILLLLMGTSRYIFDLVSWQLQSANVS